MKSLPKLLINEKIKESCAKIYNQFLELDQTSRWLQYSVQ